MLEKYEGVILPQESIKMIQEEVQTLGTDCYLHSGMYNFKVDPGDDRQVVEARFSFVWKKDDQRRVENSSPPFVGEIKMKQTL